MALIEVKVPDIGDFDEVAVIELLVKPGDTVKPEQSLVTVESDKASMEIPSAAAGIVKELKVKLGDKVKQGSVLLMLESEATAGAASAAGAPPPPPGPARSAPSSVQSVPVLTQTATGYGDDHGQPASAVGGLQATPAQVQASAAPPALTPTSASAAGPVEVRVPDIGDFKDVAVIEVLVKIGDTIKVEQSLITVESDKASMEIPSAVAGVVKELKVKLGDKINVGDLLMLLQGAAAQNPLPPGEGRVGANVDAPAAQPPPQPSSAGGGSQTGGGTAASAGAERPVPTAALPPHEPALAPGQLPHASPSIRKFARELGVPLAELKGSGPKGRITQEDVQAFTQAVMKGEASTQAQAAKAGATAGASAGSQGAGGAALGLLPWPKIDFTKFGPVERRDLSRIKKISGANLHRNWVMIPHVTNHDDADITELEAFRVQLNKENEKPSKGASEPGVKITMLAFLIKASVAALKKFPDFNSSLDGEQLVLKQYFHIGFAADTPTGLVVPVIRDADKKGLLQISQEMGELAKKARDGKLAPGDMQGACFTISSLGGIGGRYFTPIINAPEVAILGVCKSRTEPVWDGKQFLPRLVLPLSLAWDHRVIDGASAARFNSFLGQILADFRRVLL